MRYIAFIILACIIFSCNTKVETIVTEVPVLRASLIYHGDSVYSFMDKYKDENKTIADSYLQKGEQEKESNPEKAIYYYKRAITLNPTLAKYQSLADVLNKTKKYEELSSLYIFLVYKSYVKINGKDSSLYIFTPPDEDLWYNHLASCVLGYGYLPTEDIYDAHDMGVSISNLKAKFLADRRIKIDTTSAKYKEMLLQFLSFEDMQTYSRNPKFFNDFLTSIQDTSAVFEIDETALQQFSYKWDEEDGPHVSFSSVYMFYLEEKQEDKDKWFNFNFNHRFRINPSVTAVVYAIDSSEQACPKEMRHVYHRLVTYAPAATIIDSKILALQSGPSLQTARFDHGKFSITTYARTWRKPYEKKDFDNDVIKTEKINESSFEILPDGKIKESTSFGSSLQ